MVGSGHVTLTRRHISLKFSLGQPVDGPQRNFGVPGATAVTVERHRTKADITYAGASSNVSASIIVYGMPLDVMNRLTVLHTLNPTDGIQNYVTISAGDDESGMSVCFVGNVQEAWADFSGAPDGKFIVSAFAGVYPAIKPVAPTSYRGTVDVATVMEGIAAQWESQPGQPRLTLENNGVTGKIDNPYLSGTLTQQLDQMRKAAGIEAVVIDQVLAIYPKGKARSGAPIVVSPETGLVGYPAFTQSGIQFQTLYNPSIVYGRRVKVESILAQAAGIWRVDNVSHNLESEMPNGAWFTHVESSSLSREVPVSYG